MPLNLSSEVKFIKGVGEARAKAFEKLGITTVRDLLSFYPRSYEERGKITPVSYAFDGEICSVEVKVMSVSPVKYIRTGLNFFEVKAADSTGNIRLKFFNTPYAAKAYSVGRVFRAYGRVKCTQYGKEMISPQCEAVIDGNKLPYYVPVYKVTPPLTKKTVSSAVSEVIHLCSELDDILPGSARKEYSLLPFAEAVKIIHRPPDPSSLAAARRTLAFNDITVFRVALSRMRNDGESASAIPLSLKNTSVRSFFGSLPFELTSAQQKAIKEIYSDLSSPRPMARLLQGDVGSGKTVVAASAVYLCAKNGYRACVMAPTEILASQHKKTFDKLLSPFGIKTELLVSGLPEAEKRRVRESLKNGETDVVVGTHALITDKTCLNNFALAVVDEQHRFGVKQRAALLSKTENNGVRAHMLVMSATPIPRSLSLIIFGDLDVSVINELPKGRMKTETVILKDTESDKIFSLIKKEVAEGGRAYIVCPLVEESDTDERKSAESYLKTVSSELPGIPVGLIHGKMRPAEKEKVMSAFACGDTKVLVATTVIEVGVDVPEATVMVIQNAETFGLSQLHQLRGRIGRGNKKSYCILVQSGEGGADRLKVMRDTSDGFKVAEADLAKRGPGDFFGERQSGEFSVACASVADMDILSQTDALVKEILTNNDPQYKAVLKAADEFLERTEAAKTVN